MKKLLLTLVALITAASLYASVTDELTAAFFGSPSSYQGVNQKSTTTNVTYAGVMTTNSGDIQINNKSASAGYYGVYSSANPDGRIISTITVNFRSGNKNTLNIRGGNTALTSANDTENTTLIQAVTGNKAVIIVGDKGYTYFCAYSNSGAIYISSIEVEYAEEGEVKEKTELSFPEESYQVSINEDFEAPELTSTIAAALSEVKYSSSNEAVATVDASTGKVTIVGLGTTTIAATIEDSENYYDAFASYDITVFDPSITNLVFSDYKSMDDVTVGYVSFSFAKANGNTAPTYNTNDAGARIYAGNTITITAAEGYVLKYAQFLDKTDKEVSFIDGVTATRGTLTGGKWTAANRFVTTFVLTNGGKSGNTKVDHINVSVVALDDLELEEYNFVDFKDYEIQTNEEITFNLPDYAPEITFTSSDEDVAIVEEGKVVPVAPGETTITASWEDGNGWKAGTKEFKVTVISALQDPVFELVGDSYITVSEEDDLTIEFKYEGVENPQFTITSSRPEYATATVDATNKTITVDIIKRGTTEFTLSVAGNDEFDKATLKFTVKVCYKDLASILENAKEGETYTGVFPVTLVYENDSYNYVTDGTAWALFYVDRNEVENHTHGNGAVIPAGWTAKYTVYNGLPEFTEIEHEAEVTETEVVKITEYSNVTLTSDMVNQVVMLLDVEFTEATPSAKPSSYSDNFEGYFNGVDYTFRNAFGVDGVEAGVYNLKAVVNVYNRNVQIYPIEYRKQTETTTTPVVTEKTYAHGEVIEFTGLEEGAHIYYRHGGEDPDHNNVFTGSASNSPMKAAVNTTWTYNHTTHPLTFSDGQEMIVKFMAKKPGKVASEVKSVGINANGEATTGLENIAVEEAEAVYYNLQGVRVENPAAGVYVRVAGGKATKVMFK